MKSQAFAALIFASLSAGVFALPADHTVTAKANTVLAENGSDRLQERFRVASEGSFMVLDRVAENGSDPEVSPQIYPRP